MDDHWIDAIRYYMTTPQVKKDPWFVVTWRKLKRWVFHIEWWIRDTRVHPFMAVFLFGKKIKELEPHSVLKQDYGIPFHPNCIMPTLHESEIFTRRTKQN